MPAEDLRQHRYVLAGTWPAEHADAIRENGWTVVNAPRPLYGRHTWEGDFISGIFYAAGPWAEYGEDWYRNDATLLIPVTPEQVVEKIRAHCEDRGYDFGEVVDDYPDQIGSWADVLGLPWNDAWLEVGR